MLDYLLELFYSTKDSLERVSLHKKILNILRSKKSIILIAGHCRAGLFHYKDTGALCPFEDTNEHYECEKLVYKANEILNNAEFKSIICPFHYNLPQKIKWIKNNFDQDKIIVLDIHMNSHPDYSANGIETWYNDPNKEIAQKVQYLLYYKTGLANRGAKEDNTNRHGSLYILNNIKNSLLLEMGFISNKNDLKVIREKGPEAIALAANKMFYYFN